MESNLSPAISAWGGTEIRLAAVRRNCCKITTGLKKCAKGADFALFGRLETRHLAQAEGTPSFRGRTNQLALGVKR
jgi:hypothetical protein